MLIEARQSLDCAHANQLCNEHPLAYSNVFKQKLCAIHELAWKRRTSHVQSLRHCIFRVLFAQHSLDCSKDGLLQEGVQSGNCGICNYLTIVDISIGSVDSQSDRRAVANAIGRRPVVHLVQFKFDWHNCGYGQTILKRS